MAVDYGAPVRELGVGRGRHGGGVEVVPLVVVVVIIRRDDFNVEVRFGGRRVRVCARELAQERVRARGRARQRGGRRGQAHCRRRCGGGRAVGHDGEMVAVRMSRSAVAKDRWGAGGIGVIFDA